MINVRESKTFFVVKDTVVSDTVEADSKEQVRDIERNERGVRDIDKRQIYDIDEFYDTFGYYPLSFYAVKDGIAVDTTDARDKADAKYKFNIKDYDEILTEEEFYKKYNHDPISDLYEEPFQDDYDDYRSSTDGDYGPSNPWDAPGMSVEDFI